MKAILTILFSLLSLLSLSSQASFDDISAAAGIANTGRNYGLSFGDYDNDGLEDVYVARQVQGNILYRSMGDGTYEDYTAQAGVSHTGSTTMSVFGDIDNDGDLDLYLGNRDEPNRLFLNNGDGTFTDISAGSGTNATSWTRALMFGDIDQDGFIDLYVANLNTPNALYRNNGNLTFTNIVDFAGVNDLGIAMGAMLFDFDNDGDLDIYLTHDADQPNILYRNDGDLQFTDVSEASNTNYAGNGMGVDFGDVNNDGWLDIYITNLSYNTLLLNNGDGSFEDITFEAGVEDPGMGWGTVWLDYDNDGWQDIYMANDSYFSPLPNILYRNKGNNTFEIASAGTPLASMYGGYGVGCSDINDDGMPDLFLVNNGNDGNQLFQNMNQNANRWVKVKTKGTLSNRYGIGARVEIEAAGMLHVDEVCAGSGYATQNSLTLHFGLGPADIIDRLSIRWPSGIQETYTELEVNKTYEVIEHESIVTATSSEEINPEQVHIFPNPSPSEFTISFDLSSDTPMWVDILNSQGNTVKHIFRGILPAGPQNLTWFAENQPTGLYFCRLRTNSGVYIYKMVKN